MHKRCLVYAWAYRLATRAPWDDPLGVRATRWSLLVDWLFAHVCETCDEEIFGT